MPAIYSYYQIYKNLGLLHVKISLEFLKLNILLIIYSIDQNYVNACSLLVTTYLAIQISIAEMHQKQETATSLHATSLTR